LIKRKIKCKVTNYNIKSVFYLTYVVFNNSKNNNKIIKSDNANITIGNPTIPFLQSKGNQLFSHFWNMHKCLLLVILLLMIGLGIVSGFFIEKTLHFNQLTDKLKELNIEKSEIETIFF
jgi:hypothetical protein